MAPMPPTEETPLSADTFRRRDWDRGVVCATLSYRVGGFADPRPSEQQKDDLIIALKRELASLRREVFRLRNQARRRR